ncbi:hypothetical protein CBR_g19567 [Chara braunii]|uniref:quinol--cytochrome-c reductase n=1 Tax=Chara braunii TaxID=69332 RepID=A0A388KYC1_CHABU|nr:hypothetical protein CBR_g19567 [Chara braunii]|eukprot:GBG75054.1 hypothetical protein CBR_g19567 [Chara braunii]
MLARRSSRVLAEASRCLRIAVAPARSLLEVDGNGAGTSSRSLSSERHPVAVIGNAAVSRLSLTRYLLAGVTGLSPNCTRQQAAFSSTALEEVGHPPTAIALKNPTNEIVYDEQVHERLPPGDASKRAFAYFVLTGGRFVYASALRLAVLKLVLSMSASRDVMALASLEVDLGKIEPGQTVTVKWRGKPVFIRRRTPPEVALADSVSLNELRHPEPDSARVKNPEWLVVIGVCTHLGCIPLPNAGDYGGWFCPCHGSHYDISGRIRKGPAPLNLEVPEYKFLDENKLLVG